MCYHIPEFYKDAIVCIHKYIYIEISIQEILLTMVFVVKYKWIGAFLEKCQK